MKKAFGQYRRLMRGLFSCSSLWLGTDHFVYVRGNGLLIPFTEDYKRFRYRDVQAITMVRTSMYLVTSLLFGLGASFTAALIFLPSYPPQGFIVMVILFSPVLLFLTIAFIVTMVRGPSCRCEVQTAVGGTLLRPLSRVRSASVAVDELTRLIRESQEDLDEGGPFDATGGADPASFQPPAPATAPVAAVATPPSIKRDTRRSAWLVPTLSFLFPFGAVFLMHAHMKEWWLLLLLAAMGLFLLVGVIVSLAQQSRRVTPGSISLVLWAILAQQIVLAVGVMAAYTAWSVSANMSGEVNLVAKFYELERAQAPIYYFSVINGLYSLAIGVTGFGLVWRQAGREKRSAAAVAAPPSETAGITQPASGPLEEEKP